MNYKIKFVVFNVVILYTLFFLTNCKKDKNVEPHINFISPAVNSYFSVIDTIQVKCTVEDDKLIKTIYVAIIDENNVQVTPPMSIAINQRTAQIDVPYIINDIHLGSGVYYIAVTANDESTHSKAFLKIYLNEIPLQLQKIYLFSKSANNATKVFTIDTANNISYQFFFNDILQSAVTNSYFQQLSLLGKNNGRLETFSTSSNSSLWEVTNINNVAYSYKGKAKLIDNYVYVGFGTSNIKGYSNNGFVIKTADIGEDSFSPAEFLKFDDYIVAEIEPHNCQSAKISIMNYLTGTFNKNHNIDFDIVDMFKLDDEKIIIWANKNRIVRVFTLDIVYNILDEILNFPVDKLSSVIKAADNYYIAAIGNDLYKYNSITKSVSIFKQNMPCQKLQFEQLNNSIYVINGMNISVIHYPEALNINNIQHTDSIVDVNFLYNK